MKPKISFNPGTNGTFAWRGLREEDPPSRLRAAYACFISGPLLGLLGWAIVFAICAGLGWLFGVNV